MILTIYWTLALALQLNSIFQKLTLLLSSGNSTKPTLLGQIQTLRGQKLTCKCCTSSAVRMLFMSSSYIKKGLSRGGRSALTILTQAI